ncbi:MAG: hypothetical protein QNL01_08210 [Akkermansiaceae bacterium]
MKIQSILSICGLFLLFSSCEKSPQADAGKDTEAKSEAKAEAKIKTAQHDSELSAAKEEIERLQIKNEELTQRIIAREAEASTLTKLMEVGVKNYKSGSKRAACILDIRNMHQATRAHQNLNGFSIGDTLKWGDIFGPDNYIAVKPQCPHGGEYILVKTFPAVGTPAARCSHETKHNHRPETTKGW